jgi:hypothetical protein
MSVVIGWFLSGCILVAVTVVVIIPGILDARDWLRGRRKDQLD